MTWLSSLVVAALASLAGALLGALIGNACVSWYQLSPRDGGAGLAAGYAALVGGFAGFFIGLVSARLVAAYWGPDFRKELIGALVPVVLIAGVLALRLRLSADVAPTIDGRELTLEVEFRFPNTYSAERPPTAEGNDWVMALVSYTGQKDRTEKHGDIRTEAARYENGQWIVPTQVHLYTERGRREVMVTRRSSSEVVSFVLPLPRRPGRRFETWSAWTPEQQPNGQPWPADKMSCRFRVQKEPAAD